MGLGLYVARRLMEEQGGELIACNGPVGGARFLVRFPAAEEMVTGGDTSRPGADQTRGDPHSASAVIRPFGGGNALVRPYPGWARTDFEELSNVGGER
jgi:hypothetical protein